MMRILSPRPWAVTSAFTTAPATRGAPTLMVSPLATSSTSSKLMDAPTSAVRLSTLRDSPGATRYCLPPVLITAYIVLTPGILSNEPAILATTGYPVNHFLHYKQGMRIFADQALTRFV